MKILADSNIPFASEAFSSLGDVTTAPGRAMTASDVADCDALLVRSVTRVGAELLDGSRVQYVGTATIGTDHIDQTYLKECGIAFASAAGCNARSVSEYVAAALLDTAVRGDRPLAGMRLGVVGHGNVGSKIAAWARKLGMQVLVCDPPLARRGEPFVPFVELFDCHAITFHVPLLRDGDDATIHYLGKEILEHVNPDAILINTSRGPIFDNAALCRALQAGRPGPVVLDVWENEPQYDPALLDWAAIATPHIAGYSFDGKVTGTRMIQHAAVEHFRRGEKWDPAPHLPAPSVPSIKEKRGKGETRQGPLQVCVLEVDQRS
jgi:erythronate-4-phosphate dehydrogenase